VRGNVTAIIWKDKRDINTMTHIHRPPAEDNFCDELGNTLKPTTVQGAPETPESF